MNTIKEVFDILGKNVTDFITDPKEMQTGDEMVKIFTEERKKVSDKEAWKTMMKHAIPDFEDAKLERLYMIVIEHLNEVKEMKFETEIKKKMI